MSKTTRTILCVCTALYVGMVVWTIAERNTAQCKTEQTQRELQVAMGERDNAEESARQWKLMYEESLREIAALKAKNEELTRAFEETSFALDEVVYESGWTRLGTFKVTFYCPCEKCCGKWAGGLTAGGTVPTEGRTVAVDTGVIPLGTRLRIGGHEYIAEDTGVSGRTIDVFVDNHNEALQLGVQYSEVDREA